MDTRQAYDARRTADELARQARGRLVQALLRWHEQCRRCAELAAEAEGEGDGPERP